MKLNLNQMAKARVGSRERKKKKCSQWLLETEIKLLEKEDIG